MAPAFVLGQRCEGKMRFTQARQGRKVKLVRVKGIFDLDLEIHGDDAFVVHPEFAESPEDEDAARYRPITFGIAHLLPRGLDDAGDRESDPGRFR